MSVHLKRFILFGLTVLAVGALAACGDSKSNNPLDETWDGACEQDRDGWEKCDQNRIVWCHVLEGMTPHFHEGLDCQSLGLTCVSHAMNSGGSMSYAAFCVDESAACAEGVFRCQDNTAYTCIDGVMALEPCGTKTCTLSSASATCETETETLFDPQDACKAIEGTETEAKAVVMAFDEVFDEAYHADLAVKVEVTLPDNQASYIHFPVFACGTYGLFFGASEVFDGLQHRDGAEMVVSEAASYAACSTSVPDYRQIDLEWDGDGVEGDDPVPYVIRFKAVPGGAQIEFAVFLTAAEHED